MEAIIAQMEIRLMMANQVSVVSILFVTNRNEVSEYSHEGLHIFKLQ